NDKPDGKRDSLPPLPNDPTVAARPPQVATPRTQPRLAGAPPRPPTGQRPQIAETVMSPGTPLKAGPALANPEPPRRERQSTKPPEGGGDPYLGHVIAERYKVIQKLGEGGMGVVYLAEHVFIEKKVALKILSEDFARKAELVARFMQEAKAASKIG